MPYFFAEQNHVIQGIKKSSLMTEKDKCATTMYDKNQLVSGRIL